mmetsp:Transcript_9219/g.16628  ORF Transcript_9219/g.16628 Transcript_9219/m.16628 type:complete len:238 (+) Transcript_9219:155-868(+)
MESRLSTARVYRPRLCRWDGSFRLRCCSATFYSISKQATDRAATRVCTLLPLARVATCHEEHHRLEVGLKQVQKLSLLPPPQRQPLWAMSGRARLSSVSGPSIPCRRARFWKSLASPSPTPCSALRWGFTFRHVEDISRHALRAKRLTTTRARRAAAARFPPRCMSCECFHWRKKASGAFCGPDRSAPRTASPPSNSPPPVSTSSSLMVAGISAFCGRWSRTVDPLFQCTPSLRCTV